MAWDISGEELARPRQEIPDGWHAVTIEEANSDPKENGTRIAIQFGEITTPEGQTEVTLPSGQVFRYGNRKLFQRSWWEHTSPMAAKIGQRELAGLFVALGLMAKPQGKERVEAPFTTVEDAAAALRGHRLLVRTRTVPRIRKDADGTKRAVTDDEGLPVMDVNVVGWKAVAN